LAAYCGHHGAWLSSGYFWLLCEPLLLLGRPYRLSGAFPGFGALEAHMDIGKFIGRLITIGFTLAALGTLREVTLALKREAVYAQQHELISLGAFNRRLIRGR
jgi:hypothetical protein